MNDLVNPPEGGFGVFPPRTENLFIPLGSRSETLSALSLYAPCLPVAAAALKATRGAVRVAGPKAFPGKRRETNPIPLDGKVLRRIGSLVREACGPWTSYAVYLKRMARSECCSTLLIGNEGPVGFVKFRIKESKIRREVAALRIIEEAGGMSFRAPRVLATGKNGGWSWAAMEPVLFGMHTVARQPPLSQISKDIEQAFKVRKKRPAGTPPHWKPIHGDLTPWNLRVRKDNKLVLLDWESQKWAPPGSDKAYYAAAWDTVRSYRSPLNVNIGREVRTFWRQEICKAAVEAGYKTQTLVKIDEFLQE